MDRQAILALAGGFLTLVVFGSIYTFGALTPYISSYLYYQGDPTTSTALSLLFTSTLILINVGVTISVMGFSHVSNRLLCAVAVVGMSGAVFLSSYMTTFVGVLLAYGLMYGLFIGFGYFQPVKNAYLHLPDRKGLCSGVCMSGFGLGSALFNYVIVYLVNPDNESVDHTTNRYPLEIANNVPFAMKVLAGIYLGMGLLGAAFIRPPRENKSPGSYSVLSEQAAQTVNQSKETLFQIFRRKRAYLIMLQIACVAPFGMFMAFNYKRMAFERSEYFQTHDHLITTIGSVGILCNGLFRMGWGHLFDKISYKKIMITINLCLMMFCAVVLFAVQNPITYFIIIPLIYLSYGGLYAITPTQSVRVLGSEAGSKLFWLTFAGFSSSAIIQFTVQYFFLTYLKEKGYYYCIGTFFLLQIVGLVLNITTNFENEPEQAPLRAHRKIDE